MAKLEHIACDPGPGVWVERKPCSAVELRLPFPPSVNALHFNAPKKNAKPFNGRVTRGRISTSEYLSWQDQAGWEINVQKPGRVVRRCVITIDLDDSRQGDCANREKAVVDLLVTHGIIPDDSKKHVKRVSIGWEKITGCRVRVEEAFPA